MYRDLVSGRLAFIEFARIRNHRGALQFDRAWGARNREQMLPKQSRYCSTGTGGFSRSSSGSSKSCVREGCTLSSTTIGTGAGMSN